MKHEPAGSNEVLLLEEVRHALDGAGHTCLRRIDVAAEGGCFVLRGHVPSFYLKQLAQATVLAVPGVEAVRNELGVGGDSL